MAAMLALSGAVVSVAAGGCVEQDEDKPSEEDMKVAKQNILSVAPTPKFPVNADLDGKVIYLGMDAEPAIVEPGKDVKLTHYWKVVAPPGEGWRIFTHLNGPNNQPFINVDHAPVKGKYPVGQWKAGEIIRDEHNIRLPPSWTYPQLFVATGLWKPGVGRLPIKVGPHDVDGRVAAATLPVQVSPQKTVVARKRYVARMIAKPIKVDGKLDDAAWAAAPSTGLFVNTMTGAAVEQKTEAKVLWDNKFLYVAFDNAGTLNKRDDQDKGWTVEMAIPLEDVRGIDKDAAKLPPTPGDVWRIALYRMDVPTGKPQQASAWSPPMVGDFHALDKFGELVFGDDKGNVPPHAPVAVSAGGTTGVAGAKVPAAVHGNKPAAEDKKTGARSATTASPAGVAGDKESHGKK